ncbi:hypothetical protein LWI29_025865 [Acer saccharum]|uniref:Uncharacterized protein n=1 Tax=Acer saccharum TaxID=4024 RepID=A0AA39W2E0_ACESA|nr:hypothetical protein LWI29_025865 [Acer saccharum]
MKKTNGESARLETCGTVHGTVHAVLFMDTVYALFTGTVYTGTVYTVLFMDTVHWTLFRGTGGDEDKGLMGLLDDSKGSPLFGYDFWYQPRHKTMISSSWGASLAFTKVSDGL